MRFLTDENFNGKQLAALMTALPNIDIIRVQDTQMFAAHDEELLEWAASQGLPMPGVIEVRIS